MFLSDGADAQTADQTFEQLRKDFPNDPIAPWVDYYRALALLRTGAFVQADAALGQVAVAAAAPEALRQQVAIYRVIARVRNGELAQGVALRDFRDALKATNADGSADAQREYTELRQQFWAALATAEAAGSAPWAALSAWDQYWQTATPPERAWCMQQLDVAVAAIAPNKRVELWQEAAVRKAMPSAIVMARYVAAAQRSNGQVAEAAATLQQVGSAAKELDISLDTRTRMAVAAPTPSSGAMNNRMVAAVLPSSSKQQRIAEAVIAATAVAAGAGMSDRGAAIVNFVRISDAGNVQAELQESLASAAIGRRRCRPSDELVDADAKLSNPGR
jgi:hypothetical protein